MNNQEIFDAVAEHLLFHQHRYRCDGPDGHPAYRAGDRNSPIGLFLADDYSPAMEGMCLEDMFKLGLPDIGRDYENDDQVVSLLTRLMSVHDSDDDWEEALYSVAEDYGLSAAELPNLREAWLMVTGRI